MHTYLIGGSGQNLYFLKNHHTVWCVFIELCESGHCKPFLLVYPADLDYEGSCKTCNSTVEAQSGFITVKWVCNSASWIHRCRSALILNYLTHNQPRTVKFGVCETCNVFNDLINMYSIIKDCVFNLSNNNKKAKTKPGELCCPVSS